MDISGKARIFKKEYNGKELYSTSLSNKNEDGSYNRMYISVQLPKGMAIDNNTEIEITKGFLSFYKTSNGLAVPKAVIQEFTINGDAKEQDYIIDDTELPF